MDAALLEEVAEEQEVRNACELESITLEIELLKNLHHRNIVQYLGSYKGQRHLYIILEFAENGSLSQIIKAHRFGPFPESLVAVYVTQVLQGLEYLHAEGVVHRDIKGANILTTKQGVVKLADFGVATRLGSLGRGAGSGAGGPVVGTPYWMAPEVIEMATNRPLTMTPRSEAPSAAKAEAREPEISSTPK